MPRIGSRRLWTAILLLTGGFALAPVILSHDVYSYVAYARLGALHGLDPGGLEVLTSSVQQFAAALTRENHTLKRVLTDPHIVSGIGNAYSDEILHAARLSPMLLTSRLSSDQIASLHAHAVGVLTKWRDDLIAAAGDAFPEKVTAFRDGMAAHGRYGKPCPVCGTPIQRIQYASNEANYCPTCQTGGKLLADRGLSRLLKSDWPKSLDELERLKDSRKLNPRSEI